MVQVLNQQLNNQNNILEPDVLNVINNQPRLNVPDITNREVPGQRIIDTITPQVQLSRIEQERQERIQSLERDRETLRTERTGLKNQLRDVFARRVPAEDITRREMNVLGITENLDKQRVLFQEITSLQEKSINLVEQRDSAISAIAQMGVSTPFIRGEQSRIAENYDRRIASLSSISGAKSAYAEALQGNIQTARGLVKDIVEASTYDTKLELDRVTTFIDMNRDEIGMLDVEFRNSINESQRYWETRLKQEQTEKEAVLNLMIKYNQAQITLNDSVESATQKASSWLGIQPNERVEELMLKFPRANIIQSDTFSQAVNKIALLPVEGEGLREDIVGGFRVLRDNTGRIISTARIEQNRATGKRQDDFLDFTSQEKRRLLQLGIDWTTPDGYIKALNTLYGEEGNNKEFEVTRANELIQRGIQNGLTSISNIETMFKNIKDNSSLTNNEIINIMAIS